MAKVFWIVVLILLVGGYMIKVNYDLKLSENPDRVTFAKEFSKWVGQLGKSTANVVGFATKQDWKPNNPQDEDKPQEIYNNNTLIIE
jgi:hypothetical protein